MRLSRYAMQGSGVRLAVNVMLGRFASVIRDVSPMLLDIELRLRPKMLHCKIVPRA